MWLPTLAAFEAGAFAFFITDTEVFVATVPGQVKLDAERRLHCETDAAFVWLNDIREFYWHGTKIPPEWITDRKSLTSKVALGCKNLEQRRAAIDMLGWTAILNELKGRVIDEDGDPLIGTLIEVELPDLRRPARFCKVKCGTGREFAIGVPHEMQTARESQAWMQGRTLADFLPPEIRT